MSGVSLEQRSAMAAFAGAMALVVWSVFSIAAAVERSNLPAGIQTPQTQRWTAAASRAVTRALHAPLGNTIPPTDDRSTIDPATPLATQPAVPSPIPTLPATPSNVAPTQPPSPAQQPSAAPENPPPSAEQPNNATPSAPEGPPSIDPNNPAQTTVAGESPSPAASTTNGPSPAESANAAPSAATPGPIAVAPATAPAAAPSPAAPLSTPANRTATPPAAQPALPAPDWMSSSEQRQRGEQLGVNRELRFSSGLYTTVEEAQAEVAQAASEALRREFLIEFSRPAPNLSVPMILASLPHDEYVQTVQRDFGTFFAPMHRVWWRVKLSPEVKSEWWTMLRRGERASSLDWTGRCLAAACCLLGGLLAFGKVRPHPLRVPVAAPTAASAHPTHSSWLIAGLIAFGLFVLLVLALFTVRTTSVAVHVDAYQPASPTIPVGPFILQRPAPAAATALESANQPPKTVESPATPAAPQGGPVDSSR